jgi:hypothetical protein
VPRRPRLRLARPASRLPAAVLAASAAAVLWSARTRGAGAPPDGAPVSRRSFVDAAVRRLRAVVVGDVPAADAAAGTRDAGGSPRARDRRALAERVRAAAGRRDTGAATPACRGGPTARTGGPT